MDRNTYRLINQAQVLAQAFPLGDSGNTVTISIYDLDDNASDVSLAAMTFETGVVWTYGHTFTQNNNYLVDYWNQTLDVHYYEYVKVSGELAGTPGGAGTGSTLSTLQVEFLVGIDNYNANDLVGTASGGDLATKCINRGLQKIYARCKASKFMEAYPDTSLVSVADQAYIALSGISDLDEILSIQEDTNNLKLIKIPFWKYRLWLPNSALTSGTPTHYARLFNRIYLFPTPSDAITYTTEFIKTYADLSAGGDVALLPSKYNYWIYAEAEVEWFKMQDPNAIPAIVLAERERSEKIALEDIFSGFDEFYQMGNNFNREGRGMNYRNAA